ncbi:MAG: MerR family transcriptional regulator, partial [Verrucomicrobiales bacterium]
MISQSDQEQFFEISAVSRLTGVSTPNIRVWEKRHNVVEPKRSKTKRRLYTPDDIQRLTLLKALVDRGHAIG